MHRAPAGSPADRHGHRRGDRSHRGRGHRARRDGRGRGIAAPRSHPAGEIDLPHHINNTTADQIVAMANSKLRGQCCHHDALAPGAPDARAVCGWHRAGEQILSGSRRPHGASLVESGGSLYPASDLSNTALPYTQSSSLPVYGGVSSDVIGPPERSGIGIPSTYALSLNIGGQDAAKFYDGASGVAPTSCKRSMRRR